MDDIRQALYLIADEIRGLASLTRYFAENVYHQESADRMMNLAAKIAAVMDDRAEEEVRAVFKAEPWMRFSPAVVVSAFVMNAIQEILLIRRSDNPLWALPGGLAGIGSTVGESVLNALWEEAGLRGEVRRLLGIFDACRLWGVCQRAFARDGVSGKLPRIAAINRDGDAGRGVLPGGSSAAIASRSCADRSKMPGTAGHRRSLF